MKTRVSCSVSEHLNEILLVNDIYHEHLRRSHRRECRAVEAPKSATSTQDTKLVRECAAHNPSYCGVVPGVET